MTAVTVLVVMLAGSLIVAVPVGRRLARQAPPLAAPMSHVRVVAPALTPALPILCDCVADPDGLPYVGPARRCHTHGDLR